MHFRSHQESALATTRWLLLLFIAMTAIIVVVLNLALGALWHWVLNAFPLPPYFYAVNTAIAAALILGGSWFESSRLAEGGGAHVAESLGGREISRADDPLEKRLLNLVAEMAVASGIHRPRVFVLDHETGINAFVAGWATQDCVIGVTRGALEHLDRQELQGVIAHEFSHIVNGDMRLNMRLIGMVYGLQLIFHLGQLLMELGTASPGRDTERKGVKLAWVGIALLVVGYIGWLGGRVLQAAVSRQREYLADASAVQFTRNPAGIGAALRKIAYLQAERRNNISSAKFASTSHMFLDGGSVWSFAGLLSTHPPVNDRLQRIYGRRMPPLASADEASAVEVAPTKTVPGMSGFASSETAPSWQEVQPGQEKGAILAFLVPDIQSREAIEWMTQCGVNTVDGLSMLAGLPACQRMQRFEQLLLRVQAWPATSRRELMSAATAIVSVDEHVSMLEHSMLLVMQRLLGGKRSQLQSQDLDYAACATAITSLVRRLSEEVIGRNSVAQFAWCKSVASKLPIELDAGALQSPQRLELCVGRIARLYPMKRARLVKIMSELALDHAQTATVDAPQILRLVCILVDSPAPTAIQELAQRN